MTKRITLLEALSTTPSDVRRLVKRLEATQKTSSQDQDTVFHPAQGILISLIHTETEYRSVIIDSIKSTATQPTHCPFFNCENKLAGLCETFCQSREQTLGFLISLKPVEWQQAIQLPNAGKTTIRFYLQMLVENDIRLTSRLVALAHAQ